MAENDIIIEKMLLFYKSFINSMIQKKFNEFEDSITGLQDMFTKTYSRNEYFYNYYRTPSTGQPLQDQRQYMYIIIDCQSLNKQFYKYQEFGQFYRKQSKDLITLQEYISQISMANIKFAVQQIMNVINFFYNDLQIHSIDSKIFDFKRIKLKIEKQDISYLFLIIEVPAFITKKWISKYIIPNKQIKDQLKGNQAIFKKSCSEIQQIYSRLQQKQQIVYYVQVIWQQLMKGQCLLFKDTSRKCFENLINIQMLNKAFGQQELKQMLQSWIFQIDTSLDYIQQNQNIGKIH